MMLPAHPRSHGLGTSALLPGAAFLAAPFPDIELLVPAALHALSGIGVSETLAESIARIEGYNVSGSIAQRNNNPGNLRSGSGQIATANGFAVFASPEAGWAALDRQIQLDASRGLTLEQFIYKYAPPSENDSARYLQFVTSNLGVSPDTPLSQVVGETAGTLPLGAPRESFLEAGNDGTGEVSEGPNYAPLLIASAAAVTAMVLLR